MPTGGPVSCMPAYDIEALASLSRTVPSMGKKGLVRRRKGDADDRRVSVSITPRGRRVFKKALARV